MSNTYLEELCDRSIYIIREAKTKFKKVAVLWSTGKDSTTVLSLIREAFFGEIPFDVVHIDTGFKFPEIYEFRDQIAVEWNLNLVIARNEEARNRDISPKTHKRFDCCTLLKTEALKQLIRRERYDAIIVSIRRDEHGIRGKEHYMSPRDKDFKWHPYGIDETKTESKGIVLTQDVELSGWGLFATDFGKDTDHVRVHPLLHWTELDVWKYVKDRGLPINPLYFARNGKRYRSLGCMPCTIPVESNASNIDEIIKELKTTKIKEREGRAQDKEEAFIMQRLRALGYM